MSGIQTSDWFSKFKSEVISVNDADHSWHQFMSKSDENVA
jgi:hypothetical protein